MSVQIKNLSVGLGNNQLLHSVNLDVADHERIGLIGASGSGKSLITKAILGTLPRSMRVEGQILIDGVNVLELSEHERAAMRGTYMTAVFQNPVAALNPVVSVRANVELPLTLHYNLSAAERLHRAQLYCVQPQPIDGCSPRSTRIVPLNVHYLQPHRY